jgi:hypothetical protein
VGRRRGLDLLAVRSVLDVNQRVPRPYRRAVPPKASTAFDALFDHQNKSMEGRANG